MAINKCAICNNPHRIQIESAVLSLCDKKTSTDSLTLQHIADDYDVNLNDLKMHMLLHSSIGVTSKIVSDNAIDAQKEGSTYGMDLQTSPTLARQIGLREADLLQEAANEYLITLKSVGRRIKKRIADDEDSERATGDPAMSFEKFLTKPVADMYIGLGGEIRSAVKTMAELNAILNGPKDSGTEGLKSIAEAIRNSQTPTEPMHD